MPVLGAYAALNRLHSAFGRVQLRGFFRRFVRLETRIGGMRLLRVQQLPRLHLAILRLLLFQ